MADFLNFEIPPNCETDEDRNIKFGTRIDPNKSHLTDHKIP